MRRILSSLLTCCLASSFLAAGEPCKIVYSGLSEEGNWNLWVVNEDGTGEKRLTKTPWDERHPAFSQDGRRIAYSTSDGSIRVHDIAKDTHGKLELPKGMYDHPRFSPDGKELYFSAYFTQEETGIDYSHIAKYDFRSKKLESVFEQEGFQDFVDVSPDGKGLAYTTRNREAETKRVVEELWSHDIKTGRRRQLTSHSANSIFPRFGCLNGGLVYLLGTDGRYELHVMNLEPNADTSLGQSCAVARPACGKDKVYYLDSERRVRIFDPKAKTTKTLDLGRKVLSFDVWCE
jgi:Tol biopolymer transport system component